MRFLVLTQYFPPEVGAAQLRLGSFVDELRQLGHEVEVVTGMPNYPSAKILAPYLGRFYHREVRSDGLVVHRLWLYPAIGTGPRRLLNYASFAATSLVGLLKSQGADYLLVEIPPLPLAAPAAFAAKLRRLPLILNVSDLWPDSAVELGIMREGAAVRWARRFEAWAYRQARHLNAITDGMIPLLVERKGVPAEKILFLPNAIDTDLFHPMPPDLELAREHRLEGKKVILYAGTHGHAHAIDVALRAAQVIRRPDIRLVFVGDGSEKGRLVRMAEDLHLSNVVFLPPVPPEVVARLYSVSVGGLSTLRAGPLFEKARPAKMFAIMASGKPVVYSGAGEGARLVEAARAGVIIPPDDSPALARAIEALVNDPASGAAMGERGRRYVVEHLSWRQVTEEWVNQLLQRRDAAREADKTDAGIGERSVTTPRPDGL